MEIIITGGTPKDKDRLATRMDGLMEGFKFLAMEFGKLFDLEPIKILVPTDASAILNGYLPLHANNKLTGEVAMAEVFSLGGELAYVNQHGYIITRFSLLPLGNAPYAETKQNATLYNMWWRDYRFVQHFLLDHVPTGVRAIRYTLNEKSIIIEFKSLSDRRK